MVANTGIPGDFPVRAGCQGDGGFRPRDAAGLRMDLPSAGEMEPGGAYRLVARTGANGPYRRRAHPGGYLSQGGGIDGHDLAGGIPSPVHPGADARLLCRLVPGPLLLVDMDAGVGADCRVAGFVGHPGMAPGRSPGAALPVLVSAGGAAAD